MFAFSGLIGVIFGAEHLRFEPTAGVELSYGSRLRGLTLNSSGANTRQIEMCNFKIIENSKRMKDAIVFEKPVKVL